MSDQQKTPSPKLSDDDIYRVPDDLLEAKSGAPPTYPSSGGRTKKSDKGSKRILLIIVVIVIVLGAGGAAAYLGLHKSNKTVKTTTKSAPMIPSTSSQSTANVSTKHYVSSESALSLAFDYPATWQVSPATTTSSGTQTITINTTPDTLVNAAGTSVTAKAIISIRPGSAGISELSSGVSTIAQNSVQMAYTHPATDQHQYPYLTFIHLPNGSSVAGSFEEVMITGVSTFSKGDPINTGSLTGLDPIISVAFYGCNTSACAGTGSGAISITNTAWTSSATLQEVQTLFKSLQLN